MQKNFKQKLINFAKVFAVVTVFGLLLLGACKVDGAYSDVEQYINEHPPKTQKIYNY